MFLKKRPLTSTFMIGFLFTGLSACGPDNDGDGVGAGRDCDDENPNVFPGASEVCDFVDNNCDGTADEGFDQDVDGFTICNGDCDDFDANINPQQNEPPGAPPDGVDNDCDGVIDPPPPPPPDLDADGFPFDNDCNDQNFSINPGAIEVQGNNIDDDCNGQIDEGLVPCDGNLNPNDPFSFAKAIGLCHGEVQSIEFVGPSNPQARAISGSFGPNAPLEGTSQLLVSTGLANTSAHDPGINAPFGFGNQFSNPDNTLSNGCGGGLTADTVFDYTEIKMNIRVPTNAFGFSFQFQFFSSEYPTFHCDQFNDAFLAILGSSTFNGNVSFDANGNVVSVNNGFFQVCTVDSNGNVCLTNPSPQSILDGTGFELTHSGFDGALSESAGATLPLVTTVPEVVPGEQIELRFIIFDQGDGQLDSLTRVDNFLWSAVGCDPATDPNQCQPNTQIP